MMSSFNQAASSPNSKSNYQSFQSRPATSSQHYKKNSTSLAPNTTNSTYKQRSSIPNQTQLMPSHHQNLSSFVGKSDKTQIIPSTSMQQQQKQSFHPGDRDSLSQPNELNQENYQKQQLINTFYKNDNSVAFKSLTNEYEASDSLQHNSIIMDKSNHDSRLSATAEAIDNLRRLSDSIKRKLYEQEQSNNNQKDKLKFKSTNSISTSITHGSGSGSGGSIINTNNTSGGNTISNIMSKGNSSVGSSNR